MGDVNVHNYVDVKWKYEDHKQSCEFFDQLQATLCLGTFPSLPSQPVHINEKCQMWLLFVFTNV